MQLLHNQQTHELPKDEVHRDWLARRLDYPNQEILLARFEEHRRAVRRIFDAHFAEEQPQKGETTDSPEVAIEGDEHQSALRKFVRQNNEFREKLHNIPWDDVENKLCFVRSTPFEQGSGLRLITIAAVEISGLTSMLCGLFFACRIDIREGETINGGGRSRFGYAVPNSRFMGVFLCEDTSKTNTVQSGIPASELEGQLRRLMTLQQTEPARVRERLVEMFCERVAELEQVAEPPGDLSITVDSSAAEDSTALRISADDSFGFFFELSNALTISGFRILRAEIGQWEGRISDTIYVTETGGGPVVSPARVEELRTAITLIKQFTSWLPSYNDPHQALFRFRDLLKMLLHRGGGEAHVEELKDPQVLRDIGQVLGMSHHLWEDFLQVRTVDLLPYLTDRDVLSKRVPEAELAAELDRLLEESGSPEQHLRRLNAFKDNHLFRIDLRHVLGHCGPFGSFSREVTELAEIIVKTACHSAIETLSRQYGQPRLQDGSVCPFTIAALGKFGGVEMGYASDIELFAVFAEDCRTDGERQLSAGSFFERMIALANELIRSRHKGIFEIDLRMRPYGQAGSPAVSLQTFRDYFSPDGDAWPYERQSLVKMRCVAGDEPFGVQVLATCHELVYSAGTFDFDAMRAMREKQIRQLVRGGTVNAKLSSGGLVDCEYSVQALQLTFGSQFPSLRTSNTLLTLGSAFMEKLLTREEFESAKAAYMFLRELIDCLRMARGNAEDLTVPAEGTQEFLHLAKRMDSVHDSPLPLSSLESQLGRREELFRSCRRNLREREVNLRPLIAGNKKPRSHGEH